MATIIDLRNAGQLIWIDPQLEPNEQVWRPMYGLARIRPRLDDLPNWESQWEVDQSPVQQMDALLEEFCSGERLTFQRRFKPLTHIQDGIWQLKTPDLRLFGWFPVKDTFICGAIDTAYRVKNSNLYPGYANEVAHYRGQLPLDEPKFITGSDPRDVVSNYDLPE
jgi:hypothetical protein